MGKETSRKGVGRGGGLGRIPSTGTGDGRSWVVKDKKTLGRLKTTKLLRMRNLTIGKSSNRTASQNGNAVVHRVKKQVRHWHNYGIRGESARDMLLAGRHKQKKPCRFSDNQVFIYQPRLPLGGAWGTGRLSRPPTVISG